MIKVEEEENGYVVKTVETIGRSGVHSDGNIVVYSCFDSVNLRYVQLEITKWIRLRNFK